MRHRQRALLAGELMPQKASTGDNSSHDLLNIRKPDFVRDAYSLLVPNIRLGFHLK